MDHTQAKKSENPQRNRGRSNNPRHRSDNPRQRPEKVTPTVENASVKAVEPMVPKVESTTSTVEPEHKDSQQKAEDEVKTPAQVKKKAPVRRRPAKPKKIVENQSSEEATSEEPKE